MNFSCDAWEVQAPLELDRQFIGVAPPRSQVSATGVVMNNYGPGRALTTGAISLALVNCCQVSVNDSMFSSKGPKQMLQLDQTTIVALGRFPALLKATYATVPDHWTHWRPRSWDGIPSERLSAIEQICHVRDIEVDGYHARFCRTLNED